jgi:hypothetical protein
MIADANNTGDWFYIFPSVLVVECIVLFLTKYPGANPYVHVRSLREWYTRFGIVAVMSDVLSILIGIMFARYIYTYTGLQGWLTFVLILILFQLFHDIFFYICVILQVPTGHNQMIDVFQSYAEENGVKILVADALMMLSSVVLASYMKSLPENYTISLLLLSLYSLTYILFTN